MIFRLDNIIEHWATIYEPISHDQARNSKDRRFFRVKNIAQDNEWMRNVATIKSPCLIYQVGIDAQANANNRANYLHTLYFASKAVARSLAKIAKSDDDCATDQQYLMDEMAQDLLAYLHKLRDNSGKCPVTGRLFDNSAVNALRGLKLDTAEWASIPVKYNEWHLLGVNIQQITPTVQCINKVKYRTL